MGERWSFWHHLVVPTLGHAAIAVVGIPVFTVGLWLLLGRP